MPKVGTIYRHYKGSEYRVLAVARHSESEEELVVYQDIAHPEKIWARPLAMFMGTVDVDGKTISRFVEVG